MNIKDKQLIARFVNRLEEIASELKTLIDQEQEKYDNLSEGLQSSHLGQTLEDQINYLEESKSSIDYAIDNLSNF